MGIIRHLFRLQEFALEVSGWVIFRSKTTSKGKRSQWLSIRLFCFHRSTAQGRVHLIGVGANEKKKQETNVQSGLINWFGDHIEFLSNSTLLGPAFVVAAVQLLRWRTQLFLLKLSKRTVVTSRAFRDTRRYGPGVPSTCPFLYVGLLVVLLLLLLLLPPPSLPPCSGWLLDSITKRQWYLQAGLLSLQGVSTVKTAISE